MRQKKKPEMTSKQHIVDILRSIIQQAHVYPQSTFEIFPLQTHPSQLIVQGVYKRHLLGVLCSLVQIKTANGGGFRVVQKFSGLEDLVNSSSDDEKHRLKIKIN